MLYSNIYFSMKSDSIRTIVNFQIKLAIAFCNQWCFSLCSFFLTFDIYSIYLCIVHVNWQYIFIWNSFDFWTFSLSNGGALCCVSLYVYPVSHYCIQFSIFNRLLHPVIALKVSIALVICIQRRCIMKNLWLRANIRIELKNCRAIIVFHNVDAPHIKPHNMVLYKSFIVVMRVYAVFVGVVGCCHCLSSSKSASLRKWKRILVIAQNILHSVSHWSCTKCTHSHTSSFEWGGWIKSKLTVPQNSHPDTDQRGKYSFTDT